MADDEESLDDILSTAATPEVETTTPEAEKPEGQNRDEHGRFAPKGDEQQPETEQPEGEQDHENEPEGTHNAPVEAVVAERRKRQR